MPEEPIIVGDQSVVWGTEGVYSEGYVVSANNRRTGEKLEIQDNNGFTVAVIYFDHKNECQFEIMVKTAAPALERGDAITIGGVANCLVDDTDKVWGNREVQRLRVTATKYDGVVIA